MSRIPTNPVKSLSIIEFETQYWINVARQKQVARRVLYTTPVNCGHYFCTL